MAKQSILSKLKDKVTSETPQEKLAKMTTANASADGKTVATFAKKIGLKDDTVDSIGDKASALSKTTREFAGEHGGKVAAGVAAGLGALGLAKLLRRKKKDAASAAEETIQQNV